MLERDTLPNVPAPRTGTPQSWHAHGLLIGGQLALEELFPGSATISRARAGAAAPQPGSARGAAQRRGDAAARFRPQRLRDDPARDRIDAAPPCRPAHECHDPRANTRVLSILAEPSGRRVIGVQCATANGAGAGDAAGRSRHRRVRPRQPDNQPAAVRSAPQRRPIPSSVSTCPTARSSSMCRTIRPRRGGSFLPLSPAHPARAVLLPIERNRWMLSVVGRCGDRPPGSWDGLLDYLQNPQLPARSTAPFATPCRSAG